MKNATQLINRFHFSKPEVILRSLPRNSEISLFTNKYIKYLNELPKVMRIEDARNHVIFPYRSFNSVPKANLIQLIEESFEIIRKKAPASNYPSLYNAVMKSYISNEIGFDVAELLRQMNVDNVHFNDETYQILINLYCNCDEMDSVEKLFEVMKSKNIEINNENKMRIITGYIASGQRDKSKAYMEQNNLNENDMDVLISAANGYASAVDIDNLFLTINKIKEKNVEYNPFIYSSFYRRLVKSDAPDSTTEQILELIPRDKTKVLMNIIIHLNRTGYYNHSLNLLEKYKDNFTDRIAASDLLTSFNSSDCPTNTYKMVLTLLIKRIDMRLKSNFFANMNYDEAASFARTIINDTNGNIICTSLQNKAIGERSLSLLQDSLQFACDNLRSQKLNLQLQYGFIPSVLQSGMAAKCRDILDLLPQYKVVLLPAILMYNLCKGNFSEYGGLICYGGTYQYLFYNTNFRTLALEILKNVDMKELDKVSTEASKIFDNIVVNNVLANVIIEAIVMQSASDSFDRIVEIVKLAEKFDVTFKTIDIEKLKISAPEHIELYKSLFDRIVNVESVMKESEINSSPSHGNVSV